MEEVLIKVAGMSCQGCVKNLTGALSARASYDVRHDTDAPAGFEKTDTVTRVSLVYACGK